MTNPVTSRQNTLDQWRINLNTIGNNVGDPAGLYSTDGADSFVLPNANILVLAINDLNTRKVKRSGDTIANLAITTSLTIGTTLSVAGVATHTNNTASSSTTTGALVVTGGVGIGGAQFIGGMSTAQAFVATGTPVGQGSFGITAGQGLIVISKTGSTNDFSLVNPTNSQYIMTVPTGTGNVSFPGSVAIGGGLTVGGATAVTSSNFNTYSPTLTGTGASGTWGINITGNAATATNAANSTNLNNQPASFYQTALGFVPVQQQGTNKVYIGWSGTRLKATVDTTDIGNIVFDSQLAGYAPLGGAGTFGTWGINITGNAATAGNATTVTNGAYLNAANTFLQTLTVSGAANIGCTLNPNGSILSATGITTGTIYFGSNFSHWLTFDGANYSLGGTTTLYINGQRTLHNGNFLAAGGSLTPVANAYTLNYTGLPLHVTFIVQPAVVGGRVYTGLASAFISPTPSGGLIASTTWVDWSTYFYLTGTLSFIVPAGWYYYLPTANVSVITSNAYY